MNLPINTFHRHFYNAIAIFIICTLIFSCKKNKENKANLGLGSESMTTLVSEHSENYIGVKENIVVRLSDIPNLFSPEVGSVLENGIATISPSAKGVFMWKDPVTIVFTPNETLQSNQKYTVSIKTDKLYSKSSTSLGDIELSVMTLQQNLELRYENIEYDELNNSGQLFINGVVECLDFAENVDVEKTIKVSQDGNKDLNIVWSHYNGKSHAFRIGNIKRYEKDSELKIEYNGDDLDEDFKGTRTISIVRKGQFALVDVIQAESESNNLTVVFSDRIQPNQDLTGLITIENYSKAISYSIQGNKVLVYLEEMDGEIAFLTANKSIKNIDGKLLGNDMRREFNFPPPLPQIKALRKGTIIPEQDHVWFPFEAKNVKRVEIEVTRIFQNNVLQFLQYNSFEETYNLQPVGKSIYIDTIDLSKIAPLPQNFKWQKYTLDLGKMVKVEKGAIYNVKISFDENCLIDYPCNTEENDGEDEYYYDNKNPCRRYYYYDQAINTNILSSNIGVLAKGNSANEWKVVCSSLTEAKPLSGAEIEFYSFQKQLIEKASSDSKGLVQTKLTETPSFVIVKNGNEYGYLKLDENYANSTSEFDVNGKKIESGLDAFIYGERGVYRPGDTMHISVMMFNHDEHQANDIPAQFPLRLTLEDSKGKMQYDKVVKNNADHIYYFAISTKESAPTGSWKITAIAGSERFNKNVKVETVKPNRLKISYSTNEKEIVLNGNQRLNFESRWLHGASADGLNAEADVTWSNYEFTLPGKKGYKFSDPARILEFYPQRVFEGNLNSEGKASYSITTGPELLPPSALSGVIKTRVFEKSGNFSDDYYPVKAHKYSSYVGVKIPESEWGGKYIKSGINQSIPIVLVDTKGKPLANKKLTIGLYNAEWNWWYNENNTSILKYNSDQHIGALSTYEVRTDAKGEAKFTQNFDDYRNYLIRICDQESGHCTGDFFYSSPWGNPPSNAEGPQLLTLKSDKEEYKTGETVKLRVPSNANSKILISLEKGNGVDQIFWVDGKDKETLIDIPVTKAMTPNVYVHVTLIQPYLSNEKGLPLRMYGILPLKINDPARMLNPVVTAPNIIEPGANIKVNVSEKNGEAMSYTLALVDEGLLDLTRFKTPDPLDHFFSKQALNVNTWDLYDKVMNRYGDNIENLFSIGGDGENLNLNTVKNQSRFVPVVRYFGPFTLKKGEKKDHSLRIDNYVGSVKLMLVAKSGNKFGHAEKVCPVKKDLMVQTTVPRIVAPGDEFAVGANVFAMNDNIRNVSTTLLVDKYFTAKSSSTANLNFEKQGDKLQNFLVKVKDFLGFGKIGSRVKSGNISAEENIDLEVRNPNQYRTEFKDIVIDAGKTSEIPYTLFGTVGSNKAEIELSTSPIFNMSSRLRYLIQYPYGCIEQTTSSAFPQLYLPEIVQLSSQKKNEVANNISKAIQRIALFQTSGGGFGYWPGDNYNDEWATNYAGHFLIEAKSKGYYVPDNMLNKWISYQSKKAVNYKDDVDYQNHTQAYRLYVLAKVGKPEVGAMNRLKAVKNLDQASMHNLSAAYALIGKKDVAKQILTSVKAELVYAFNRNYDYYTYGSALRNKAIYLETYMLINDGNKSASMIRSIVQDLKSADWYSTQSIAFALMSIQKYFSGSSKEGIKADIFSNGKLMVNANTDKKLLLQDLIVNENSKNQSVKITNKTNGKLHIRLSYTGQDELSKGVNPDAKNLLLSVKYVDSKGSPIDVKSLKQGSNFTAKIEVRNPGTFDYRLENLALNFIIPAGWEINNDRLGDMDRQNNAIQYQDFRDDRVVSFFDLYQNAPLTVSIPLTATYKGNFYYPAVSCETMYFDDVYARTASAKIVVD